MRQYLFNGVEEYLFELISPVTEKKILKTIFNNVMNNNKHILPNDLLIKLDFKVKITERLPTKIFVIPNNHYTADLLEDQNLTYTFEMV